VKVHAADIDNDQLYYKFELVNNDLNSRIGIQLPGSHILSNKISGGSNTIEICAYQDDPIEPPDTINMSVLVSDDQYYSPSVQALVPFYIDDEEACLATSNCSSKKCYNGDVWCYNDCGERDYRDEICKNGCSNGKCDIAGVNLTGVSYIDNDTSTGNKLYYIDVPIGYKGVEFSLAVPVCDPSAPDAFDLGANLPSTGEYPSSSASADVSDLDEIPCGASFEFTSASSPPFERGRYYILVEKKNSGGPFRIRARLRSY